MNASPPDEHEPLRDGAGTFQGMVRPTKGGYHVGAVVLDDDELRRSLARSEPNAPKDPEWFLGAVVRVTATLRHVEATPPEGEVVQMRIGSFWQATKVTEAVVVAPAAIIEGTLSRSKGLFEVAGKLVTREDLAWSLSPTGGREGERVRLFGQPRTHVCKPGEQCLSSGEIPLFDVGRAQRVP